MSTPQPGPGQTTTPDRTQNQGRTWTIVAFVLAVIAVFVLPPIFGIAGAISGYVGYRKGDELGKWAALAGVAGMIVGLILGIVAFTAIEGGANGGG